MTRLLHHLVQKSAEKSPDAVCLMYKDEQITYAGFESEIRRFASWLLKHGFDVGDRVAVYLEKRFETVIAMFGASLAGCCFVPVNPLLKPAQVRYILEDCDVRLIVTSAARYRGLKDEIYQCPSLVSTVLTDAESAPQELAKNVLGWDSLQQTEVAFPEISDADLASILYTSGSTGRPKGVVLSHRNMVVGAVSVATYLENRASDCLLSVLPFSFDYGLSQLTTAFYVGARVAMVNYLFPKDVLNGIKKYNATGLAAVPPLWIQLAQMQWPQEAGESLRYITNSGGAMPVSTLVKLREQLPRTKPYLMYGLTEAFRSTYLPPEEIDRRPESIGKAIPNAQVMVINAEGNLCQPGEPGELVHLGELVAKGYWNDPERTAERFKPAPQVDGTLSSTELAVWSGDTVKTDDEGFLYFIGRKDEMIKTSGYRVSPSEIEEAIYASGLVKEVVAIGIFDEIIGQAIALVVQPGSDNFTSGELLAYSKKELPAYMVPKYIETRTDLPRNPNGKIDRKELAHQMNTSLFGETDE